MLVVTERGTDLITSFAVGADGRLGDMRVVPSSGPTPYGFAFTHDGTTLIVTEAFRAEKGAAAASSYKVSMGEIAPVTRSLGDGRSEICWTVVSADGRSVFTTNFADGAVSRYAIGMDGSLTLADATAGLTEDGRPGLRDEDLSSDGRVPVRDRRRRRPDRRLGRGRGRVAVAARRLGRGPDDGRRPGRELNAMRLESLYGATWTTPEAYQRRARRPSTGTEGRSFLLAEGRTEDGRLSARLRAANFPRTRVDGALTPDFRGVLETDDGATVLFSWQGLARSSSGMRELVGSVTHETGDERYAWLNDRVCALAGEVRPDGKGGFEVVVEVYEIVWESVGEHVV